MTEKGGWVYRKISQKCTVLEYFLYGFGGNFQSTLPCFCLSHKIQGQETTVTEFCNFFPIFRRIVRNFGRDGFRGSVRGKTTRKPRNIEVLNSLKTLVSLGVCVSWPCLRLSYIDRDISIPGNLFCDQRGALHTETILVENFPP